MINYIIKRLLIAIPLLLGITFITFLLLHLAPGNFLGNLKLNPQISPEVIKLYEEQFYLNKPFFIQYIIWVKNILTGNFGYSFTYKAQVSSLIFSRLFNTLILTSSALVFTWILVIPLGVIAQIKKNKFTDKFIAFLSYIGVSLPEFFLAIVLIYLVSFTKWLPLTGMHSIDYFQLSLSAKIIDLIRHLIIPVIVLSLGSICALQRIMRSNLSEVLNSSYILGARARGLSRRRIFYIHSLKNALNPMITIFGYQLATLLSGAALVEIIIGWPGLGVIFLEAIRAQDLYLVMAAVLMAAVMLIIGNLIADIMLAYFDPRIRYENN